MKKGEGVKKVLAAIGLLALVGVVGAYLYTVYLVHQHRKPVLAQLKDPDSAKFQNERLRYGRTLKSSILCGEVNAKNEMGGYVGYRLFAASGDTMKAEIVSDPNFNKFLTECED